MKLYIKYLTEQDTTKWCLDLKGKRKKGYYSQAIKLAKIMKAELSQTDLKSVVINYGDGSSIWFSLVPDEFAKEGVINV